MAAQVFYLLVCRDCGDDVVMPFGTEAERGHWAAEHLAGTGHDHWRVWTETRPG